MAELDFNQVYLDHREKVWRLTSRYVSLKHDREDLFQEVFLQIHKSLPKFRGESAIETWIYRVTVNTALNYLKKQKRYKLIKDTLSWLRVIEVEEKGSESDKIILKPLEKLNPQQRTILLLAEIEEKKLEEISQMMNIPVGTVKSNLHRAKDIIRRELSNNG